MSTKQLPWVIPLAIIIIIGLWILFWRIHTYNAEKHYRRIGFEMKKKEKNNSNTIMLLKMFFYRQTTYEFSGYAVLVLAIFSLISCILLFIFANQIVLVSFREKQINPSEKIFLVSLLSLRVGIAVVIFFICQILLRLYRFCIKVSVFYTGLFDALFIHDEIKKDIGDAIQLFSGKDGIDGDPTVPADQVIEILKNLQTLKKE